MRVSRAATEIANSESTRQGGFKRERLPIQRPESAPVNVMAGQSKKRSSRWTTSRGPFSAQFQHRVVDQQSTTSFLARARFDVLPEPAPPACPYRARRKACVHNRTWIFEAASI